MSEKNRVLVVGAGPVGFTVALNLAHRGIPCTILEGSDRIFDDPRAGTIHPPTLEMFDTLGVTPIMLEQGYVVTHYQYRDRKQGVIADFDLGVLKEDTKYPYRLMLEQHKICYILRDLLTAYPDCNVLMQHRVAGVSQDADGVLVQVDTPTGPREFRGGWLVGCDGGRSQVRKSMEVSFDGFTYEERFLVLSTRYDFGRHGYALTNYIADPDEWCALFKVPGADGKGMWRVVFPADAKADPAAIFEESLVQRRVQGFQPEDAPYEIVHRNLYDVHQRVASAYRRGRVMIAGDAAHINNPLGGMGMNFGFHDAFNLTQKLTHVMLEGAPLDLLAAYDRQRRTVAQEYLQRQTIENKRNIEQKDPAAQEAFYRELRAITADRDRLRTYLLRIAMIEGVRRAQSIA